MPGQSCRKLLYPQPCRYQVEVRGEQKGKREKPRGYARSHMHAAPQAKNHACRGVGGGQSRDGLTQGWWGIGALGSGATSPWQFLYTRPNIPNTRPGQVAPLGLCALTIFSQAGEKIACQLGRGWPGSREQGGSPGTIDSGPGLPRPPLNPSLTGRATGCPCPVRIPLLFLAGPSTEVPPPQWALAFLRRPQQPIPQSGLG